jgi:hypothetical protein
MSKKVNFWDAWKRGRRTLQGAYRVLTADFIADRENQDPEGWVTRLALFSFLQAQILSEHACRVRERQKRKRPDKTLAAAVYTGTYVLIKRVLRSLQRSPKIQFRPDPEGRGKDLYRLKR